MSVRLSYPIQRLAAGAAARQPAGVAGCGAGDGAAGRCPPRRRPTASGFERVVLTAGRSTVLSTTFDVTRIAVTNPAVADAVVVAAARGPDRRQERRNGQPDRVGRTASAVSTTWWSIPA